MKKSFIIFFIILPIISLCRNLYSSENYWIRTNNLTTQVLRNCFFINNNTGWVSGDSGTIIKTTNGGNDWNFQNSGIFNSIESIFFLNERLGWATAWELFPDSTKFPGTMILKTTNGGSNWISSMFPDTNSFLRTILFLDSLKGFVGGFPSALARTTNNGVNWIDVEIDTTSQIYYPILNIAFLNEQIGFACGGSRDIAGVIWKTTNSGIRWSDTVVGPEPLTDLGVIDDSKLMAVGGDFEYGVSYVRTQNQGVNWQYSTLDIFGVATAVDFRTQTEGWISVTSAQKLVYTLNSGNNWISISTPDNTFINDIFFSDSLNGWAVGNEGVILRYNPIKVGTFQNYEKINPEAFILYQNYPNPFNPLTIINYQLPMNNYVTLIVYDALGKEVARLINLKQNAGNYQVEFDGGNLPSGVYFYELKVAGHSQVRKMLLLK